MIDAADSGYSIERISRVSAPSPGYSRKTIDQGIRVVSFHNAVADQSLDKRMLLGCLRDTLAFPQRQGFVDWPATGDIEKEHRYQNSIALGCLYPI